MDEISALSPTNSIDCFSDTELDLDGPPIIGSYRSDENPDISVNIENAGSKVESLRKINITSSNKSVIESRDMNEREKVDPPESRDPGPDDTYATELPVEPELKDQTTTNNVKSCASVESIKPNPSQATVETATYLTETVEAFSKIEPTAKSFESSNWPIDSSKFASFTKSDSIKNTMVDTSAPTDVIPVSATENSNRNEVSQPTDLSQELTVLRKPTVSFADDVSQAGNSTIETKGSNLSKKSVKSRMSLFSIRKTKSTDSSTKNVATNKSVKTNNSGKPPMVPVDPKPCIVEEAHESIEQDEPSLNVLGLAKDGDVVNNKVDIISSEAVSGKTSDTAPTPDATTAKDIVPPAPPLQLRQNSMQSKRSKSSTTSGNRESLLLVVNTSKSIEESAKKINPSVSTPKLFGPPHHLPRWGGIAKSSKSITSDKGVEAEKEPDVNSSKVEFRASSVRPVRDDKSKVSRYSSIKELATEGSRNLLSPHQSPSVTKPPGRLSASVKSIPFERDDDDNQKEGFFDEPLLDATSTLTSKSSKQNDVEEILETSLSKHSEADVCTTEEALDIASVEQTVEAPISVDEHTAPVKETIEPPTAKSDDNVPDEEVKEPPTVIDNDNAPDEEVKGSPTVIDDDMKNDEKASESLTLDIIDIDNDPITTVMQPFSPINVPVCASIEDTILKQVTPVCLSSEEILPVSCHDVEKAANAVDTTTIETKPQHRKREMTSLRRLFGNSKAIKDSNENNAVTAQKEDKISLPPAHMLTNVMSKLLSPKRALIVESETAIEVDVSKSGTGTPVKVTSPKHFGVFKRSSPSKLGTKAANSEKTFDHAHDVEDEPVMTPIVNVPVEDSDFTKLRKDKSVENNVNRPESQSVDDFDVGYSDVDEERHDITATTKSKSNKSGFFKTSRLSNERKRQIAKNFKAKSQKVAPKHKVHDVKLSAKIDDKVVVENLRVNRNESLKKARELPSIQSCDQPKPIIVVDHRSSKKVETIGKFNSDVQQKDDRKSQLDRTKLVSDVVIKSKYPTEVENNRVYTSDDTVTETELTQVAKLDVPLETGSCKNIPNVVIVDDEQADVSTVEKRDEPLSSVGKECRDENQDSSWMTSLVEWCTPKPSMDMKQWISCAVQGANSTESDHCGKVEDVLPDRSENSNIFTEVIAEFNDCQNFYLKTNTDKVNHNDATAKNWSKQVIEWMSPKSTQETLETTPDEALETVEPALEMKEFIYPIPEVDEQEVKIDHEGTEIALTNFDSSICHQGRSTARRRGFSAVKGMFGKSLRLPLKKADQGASLKPTNNRSLVHRKSCSDSLKGISKPTLKIQPKIKEERTHHSLRKMFRSTKSETPKKLKTDESFAIISNCAPFDYKDDVHKELTKVEEQKPNPPNAALFTFTSDDCVSETPQLSEVNTGAQRGCCGNTETFVTETNERHDDQTSKDNVAFHHFIAGQAQLQTLDDNVGNTVNYLEMIKSKRQAKRQQQKEEKHTEAIKADLNDSKDKMGKVEDLVNASPAMNYEKSGNANVNEYQYRVNAVSDEVVDEMKSTMSDTFSSMNDNSFLSSKDETIEEKPTRELYTNRKTMLPAKVTRRVLRRKEEDSVGVSVNSANHSFNDDLSVAFAPAVGKWLW